MNQKKKWFFSLCLLLATTLAWAQGGTVTVTGQVTDQQGEPLIGATVIIDGQTTGGTVTDFDGKYTIKSSSKATLKFSYIGYQDQKVAVNGRSTINVQMKEDDAMLEEVVVVGYGTVKKESLTGAVTVIDSKALENKGTMSSPLQALQGSVPGVIVTRGSGAPGDESWGMSLRGAVSTNTADPLVIVDGVEYSDGINGLRLINSNDIESINFLKDASAAIYGSKAAGGVVLITTKQAKSGKVKVEYNGSFTGKKVAMKPSLMNVGQWCDYMDDLLINDGGTNTTWMTYIALARQYKGQYIDLSVNPNPNPSFTDLYDFVFMDNNWFDTLWGNSHSTEHNLSVSGGTDKNTFRLSLGYIYDGSTLQWGENYNRRYNLRLNNKFQLLDNLTLNSDIAYNRQDQVTPTQLSLVLNSGYPQPGLPVATIDGKPYAWGSQYAPNWFAEAGGENWLHVSAINISEKLSWNIYKDLDAVVTLGYNTSTATRDAVTKPIEWYNYTGTISHDPKPTQANSSFSDSYSRTDFYMASGYLNWHKTLKDVHNLSVMAGAQYNYTQYKYTNTEVLDINPVLEIPNGSGETTVSGAKWHEAMMSYFGRLNYDYAGRYLLEGQARYDGSSKFQPENRWEFFWGASAGWRITEEKFMKPLQKYISNLKLRLSYGVVGNQSGISRYDGTQLYNVSSGTGAYLGSSLASTIDTNGTLASTDRTWERIHNYNIGLDFGFLDNRLTGTFELFWKKNNNMLISVQYPGILGDSAPAANKGEFKAHGWEGTVNWSDKIGPVTYHAGVTLTYATNKVIDDGTDTDLLSAGFRGVQKGYPLNSYFGYLYMGKIQNEATLEKYTDYYYANNSVNWNGSLRLGDNMYQDVNGDGKLDQNDLVYLGSDDPKFSYSFNVGAEWNGFDFSVQFQGVGKRTLWRDRSATGINYLRVPGAAIWQNTTTESIGNTWSVDNPNAFYPTYTSTQWINIYNYQISSWSVEDASYIRLKNLTIGYSLPRKWLEKLKVIERLRIYFVGTDLWEHSNLHSDWDPEQKRTAFSEEAGYAYQRFPFNRTYTVGINVTF